MIQYYKKLSLEPTAPHPTPLPRKDSIMSNKPLILCVDDEPSILELLTFNLEANGYAVMTATNGADALNTLASIPVSLVLLDLMLPDMDGNTVCKKIRTNTMTATIPIIMLTAKNSEMDIVLGLELGADNYMTKPFSVREVVARVKALLRRTLSSGNDDDMIYNGPLTINSLNYEAFIDGKKLQLTLKEFELLRVLGQNMGKVLTRDYLLDRLWGHEFTGETRTVDVHIQHLRMKLGEMDKVIETTRGVGYKMVKA